MQNHVNHLPKKRLILGMLPDDFDPSLDIFISPVSLTREGIDPTAFDLPEDPFATVEELTKAHKLTAAYANGRLADLTDFLNTANDSDYSVAFWRFMIMPWLLSFTEACWELQARVEKAVHDHAATVLEVELLEGIEGIQFGDTGEWDEHGALSSQLVHALLSVMVRAIAPSNWILTSKKLPPATYQSQEMQHIRWDRCQNVYGFGRLATALFHTVLRLKHSRTTQPRQLTVAPQTSLAWKFDFDALMKIQMPRIFFNIEQLRPEHLDIRPGALSLIGPVSWWTDQKKYILARRIEAGENIIVTQHGSNYGNAECFSLISETEYKNEMFFTWGWEKHGNYDVNTVALPSPYLSKLMKFRKRTNNDVLLTTTRLHAANYRLDTVPQPADNVWCLKQLGNFVETASDTLRKNLHFRPYSKLDACFNSEDWMTNRFPELPIVKRNFHEAMFAGRLIILDHPGTTLLICLASNIPILTFWDDRMWKMCKDAEPYFQGLRDAGLLHPNGTSAAAKTNDILDNLENWWETKPVQKARMDFVEAYALTNRFWWLQWLRTVWSCLDK